MKFYSLKIEDEAVRLTYMDPYKIETVRSYLGTKEEIVEMLLKNADDTGLTGHARCRIVEIDAEGINNFKDKIWCGSGRKKDWKEIAKRLEAAA